MILGKEYKGIWRTKIESKGFLFRKKPRTQTKGRIALRLKNEWQLGVECQVGNKQQPLRNGGCCVFFLVFTLFYIFYYYYYFLFDYLILKTS